MFTGDEPLTLFAPLVLSNLLFVLLPAQAIFLAPAFSRHTQAGHDWYWSTPAYWAQTVTAQAVAYGLIVLALTALLLPVPLLGGVLLERWTWLQVRSLLPSLWSLTALAALAQVLAICGLSLLFRRTLVTVALVSAFAVGVYLGLVTPKWTLLGVRDITLRSLSINPVTGLALDYPLARGLLLFHAALGLLCWLTALLAYPWRESRVTWSRSLQWSTGAAWLASIFLVVLAGHARQVQAHTVPAPVFAQSDSWTVRQAHHQTQWEDGTLQAETHLSLSPRVDAPEQQVVLMLNTGLQIQAAYLDGVAVDWSRTGETVRLASPIPPATPSGPRTVVLSYGGRPVLLREDYQRTDDTTVLRSIRVNSHTREIVSYAGSDFMQWFRDGDWLAWPVTSKAHVATDSNRLEIVLPREAYAVAAAPGAEVQAEGRLVRYVWQSTPPSVLLIAGSYHAQALPSGQPVLLGPLQTPGELAPAAQVVAMHSRLVTWLGSTPSPSQVLYFPHGERLHFAGPWIMMPATPALKVPRQDTEWQSLALRVTEDWLREVMAWRPAPVFTQGLRLNVAIACDLPGPDDRQVCWLLPGQYGRNPQTPQGRAGHTGYCLYPSVSQCGDISPQLRALALVLTNHVVAEESWRHPDIWERWREVADDQSDGFELLGMPSSPLYDICTLARNVVTIQDMVTRHGPDFLREWVALMAEHHPVGSPDPVDKGMWHLAAELTGEVSELYDASCTSIVVEE